MPEVATIPDLPPTESPRVERVEIESKQVTEDDKRKHRVKRET
jgi:hypothetical protein